MPREIGCLGRQLHGQPVCCRQLVRQHAFQAVARLDRLGRVHRQIQHLGVGR